MKFNKLKLFTLVIALASLISCSKKSTSKSNTELLTQSSWKVVSGGLDLDKNGTVDAELVTDCVKDNSVTFVTGGTGTIDEGATKCDSGDPQTESFAWLFKNGEKELEFDGESFTILSLSDNQLKIYFDYNNDGAIQRTVYILNH
ncbi:MAG: hypothetical protein ACKVOW_16950 [Chitinophagaceae bacterium]